MKGEELVRAPNFAVIVAMDRNNLIGKDNHLPWHITEDLAYFRRKTLDHNIVMGRNTWKSLGKPLELRTNIVLTRDQGFHIPGAIICHSIEEVLTYCGAHPTFVIGGAKIFDQFIPLVGKLYITRIEAEFAGDTYFPAYDEAEWELISFESVQTESGLNLSFNEYARKPV